MDVNDFADELEKLLPDGWTTDGDTVTCPHAHTIELDGSCPQGCMSPLLRMGLI
ncbi:hypothetical protein ACIBKY_51455 [Nonomuraea sp. NPDC050394]|uniref:hypothetical protein n=1 Tax=Nonomuraea sp. NPDC050394 TaxID=3364363 RepID=UPI0037919805